MNAGEIIDSATSDPHPLYLVTMSPTVWQGVVYVGASSVVEVAAAMVSDYDCCSFFGSAGAFRLNPSTSNSSSV